MQHTRYGLFLLLLITAVSTVGCAGYHEPGIDDFLGLDGSVQPVPVSGVRGVTKQIYRDGRVFISGQPSPLSLRELAELGVTVVVNLRTPREMDDRKKVPYDEAAAVADLGLTYVNIPLEGKEYPYRPEVLAELDRVLRAHEGSVLLHCRSASRASYVWAGYLVRFRGWGLNEAIRRGMAMGIADYPLQGLLGRDLKFAYR